ncbi:MAG: cation transporter [Tannerellaceae bacterium]|jgi:Cu(I)/Ag(I) efflux system membrane fusion protein|nr:cation transporter [Tannerellaceae bacterium]
MKRILFLIAVIASLSIGCVSAQDNGNSQEANTSTLTVQGSCGMCKSRIEKAAKGVKGVSTAEWNKEKKELRLNFDPAQTNLSAISKAVAKTGHDTNKDKADQAVYDALPACCKYR